MLVVDRKLVTKILRRGKLVKLIGGLCETTVSEFKKKVIDLVDEEGELTIDMRQCTYIDSSGIGALVGIKVRKDLYSPGKKIKIIGSKGIIQLMEKTGLIKIFEVSTKH